MSTYLTIYTTNLTPSRNALVDEIATYLDERTTTEATEIQYQKIALDMSVKVVMKQSELTQQSVGNYCSIAQDGMTYYYFITSVKWVSANTILLDLSIDSINTFRDWTSFSSKTNVIREHRDRFRSIEPITVGTEMRLYRQIDDVDEGITPVKIKSSDTKITDSDTQLNQKWYLVYRTPDEPTSTSPIECLLMPTKSNIKYTDKASTITWAVSDFSLNAYYYWLRTDNDNGTCTVTTGSTTNSYALGDDCEGLVFYRTSDNFYGFKITKTDITAKDGGTLTVTPIKYLGTASVTTWTRSTSIRVGDKLTADLLEVASFDLRAHTSGAAQYLATISTLDRTQSTLLKIIECPYCPINMNFTTSGALITPTGWTISAAGLLKLVDHTTELSRTLSNVAAPPLQVAFSTDDLTDFTHQARDIKYESKLYNSAFYTYKFAYDSFSTELQLENIGDYTYPVLSIQYKQANTITSDCGFRIDSASRLEYKSTGDYDLYILSSRNNESPIYTNEYLDYIRTGYNYDRKNQVASNTSAIVGASASIVGAVGSFMAAVPTNGLSLVAAASLTTTAITTIANSATTLASTESSIQQKIAEAKAQASSIAASNDINLLSWYSGNKLHLVTYQATDKMRDQLWDLFHYCGYATNVHKVPDLKSRYWFNYVQCDLDIVDLQESPLITDFVDDIKARWSAGVTVYHRHNDEYDWDQRYENWEVGFIG